MSVPSFSFAFSERPLNQEGHRKTVLLIVKDASEDSRVIIPICECDLECFEKALNALKKWVEDGALPEEVKKLLDTKEGTEMDYHR